MSCFTHLDWFTLKIDQIETIIYQSMRMRLIRKAWINICQNVMHATPSIFPMSATLSCTMVGLIINCPLNINMNPRLDGFCFRWSVISFLQTNNDFNQSKMSTNFWRRRCSNWLWLGNGEEITKMWKMIFFWPNNLDVQNKVTF